MEIHILAYVLVFLVVCFCLYKFVRRMNKRRNAKLLWNPKDEENLSDILNRIYSSSDLENLQNIFIEGIRKHPKYHNLFKVAMEEREQQIAKNTLILSFEAKESKTRKTWLLSFFTYHFIYWLSFMGAIFFIDSPIEDPWRRFGATIPGTVFVGLMILIAYHCAYKKKGTRLLSWIVFISPILVISSLLKEFLLVSLKKEIDLSLWCLTAFFILAVFGFYWFSSSRLRKVNFELKAKQQLAGLRSVGLIREPA